MRYSLPTTELKEKIDAAVQNGILRIHEASDQLVETIRSNAGIVTKNANDTYRKGREKAIETEELVVDHVRQYPVVYALAIGGLIGILIAKIALDRRSR